MKNILKSAILSVVISAGNVYADAEYCVGYIQDWEVARWGTLYVDGDWNGSNNSQALCKLDGSTGGVTAEACKAWMLTVQDAAKHHIQVKLMYEGVASCAGSDLGEWSNAKAPEYIRVYGSQ